jgi:hypothetical protein
MGAQGSPSDSFASPREIFFGVRSKAVLAVTYAAPHWALAARFQLQHHTAS